MYLVSSISETTSPAEQSRMRLLDETKPVEWRSQVDNTLPHGERFRQCVITQEYGRAYGIFMGYLRGSYEALEDAIKDLCEGIDLIEVSQGLLGKSRLFRMIPDSDIDNEILSIGKNAPEQRPLDSEELKCFKDFCVALADSGDPSELSALEVLTPQQKIQLWKELDMNTQLALREMKRQTEVEKLDDGEF